MLPALIEYWIKKVRTAGEVMIGTTFSRQKTVLLGGLIVGIMLTVATFSIACAQTIANNSFESPDLGSGSVGYNWVDPNNQYVPNWTFSGEAGIHRAPQVGSYGSQSAFLSNSASSGLGAASQAVTFPAAGNYVLKFVAGQSGPDMPLRVTVDGAQIGELITPYLGDIYWIAFSVASAGNHTIAFAATNSQADIANGDSVTVDYVTIQSVPVKFANPSFESGTANWTMGASAYQTSNGDGSTGNTPDGSLRVRLGNSGGSITQTINFPAGIYSVTFRMAKPNFASANPFRFLVDGQQIGALITPAYADFQTYTTATFAVLAGNHTLKFETTSVSSQASYVDAFLLNVDTLGQVAKLAYSPAYLSFNSTYAGTAAPAQTITVTNQGNIAMTIANLAATLDDYWILPGSTCGVTVAPMTSCSMIVQLVPYKVATRSALLQFASNAVNNPSPTIQLAGAGHNFRPNGAFLDSKNAFPSITSDHVATEIMSPLSVVTGRVGGGVLRKSDPQTIPVTVVSARRERDYPMPEQSELGILIGTFVIPEGPAPEPDACAEAAGTPEDPAPMPIEIMRATPFVFDPIDAATGNKFHEQNDYVGVGMVPLSFTRRYNSLPFASSANSRQNVGPNWVSNWDRSVTYTVGGPAVVTRGDGKSYLYNKLADGTWLSTPDVVGTLTRLTNSSGVFIGWAYKTTAEETESFDTAGRLTSVAAIGGLSITFGYDGNGRLAAVQNSFGRQLGFTYDARGRLATLVDPAGGATVYGYDSVGRLATVAYPDGRSRQYRYDDPTYKLGLTAIVDGAGVSYVTFSYDGIGRATASHYVGGIGGGTISYPNYNFNSAVVTNSVGTTSSLSLSMQQSVVNVASKTLSCTNCGAPSQSLAYNSMGALTNYVARNGVQTNLAYDAKNLPTLVTHAVGLPQEQSITITWHSQWRLPLSIITPTVTTTFQYDTGGRLLQKSVASGGQTRTTINTYNAQGLLATTKGPRTDVNDTTAYTYDGFGNLATVTNPLGQITRYTQYDAHGNALQIEYADGQVQTRALDQRGRLLTDSMSGRTTTNSFNVNGDLSVVTAADGSTFTYLRDAAHRVTGKDLSNGDRIRYTLDSEGRATKTETFDSSGVLATTARAVYDGLGRITQTIGATGQTTSFLYDANGNVTQVTDPNSKVTQTTYDAMNRPILVKDPLNGQVQTTYTATGSVASIKDPNNNTTTYAYNGFDENTQAISPDTGTTTVTFDAGGNPTGRTDARAKSSTYTYDALGRVTQTQFSDGSTGIVRTFDVGTNGVGRLVSVTDPSGSTQYAYNLAGDIVTKTVTIAGVSRTIGYQRDGIGRVDAMTYPSGKVLAMTYSQGKVSALTLDGSSIATDIRYFPFGMAESWVFGNGSTFIREIDTDNRIFKVTTPEGFRSLAFDQGSRITAITINNGGVLATQSFGYDGNGRLTSFAGFTSELTSETRTYSYDANGNRLAATLNGVSRTYNYLLGTNKLAGVTGSGPDARTNTYDAMGNLTGDGARQYSYDARGRLIQAVGGGLITTYKVNAAGQRVFKSNGQETTLFMYDDYGNLIGEYDATGGLKREHFWLGDTPIAVVTPTLVGYVYSDHLRTPRAIVNSASQLIWAWESAPFGETPANANPAGLGPFTFNLRFPGQYYDSESGLHQNWNRDYDSQVGRYAQSDPLGLRVGTNTYSYVRNSPIGRSDASGLSPCLTAGSGFASYFQDLGTGIIHGLAGAGVLGPALSCYAKSLDDKAKANLQNFLALLASDANFRQQAVAAIQALGPGLIEALAGRIFGGVLASTFLSGFTAPVAVLGSIINHFGGLSAGEFQQMASIISEAGGDPSTANVLGAAILFAAGQCE